MSENIEEIKTHIKKHKVFYIFGGGICLISGIALGVALKRQIPSISNVVAPIFNNNNSSNVDLGGYTHKIVKCFETGDIWETVKDAAESNDVDIVRMSRCINGHIPHINGFHYSVIGLGTN